MKHIVRSLTLVVALSGACPALAVGVESFNGSGKEMAITVYRDKNDPTKDKFAKTVWLDAGESKLFQTDFCINHIRVHGRDGREKTFVATTEPVCPRDKKITVQIGQAVTQISPEGLFVQEGAAEQVTGQPTQPAESTWTKFWKQLINPKIK